MAATRALHRGPSVGMIRQLGISPPSTDFTVLPCGARYRHEMTVCSTKIHPFAAGVIWFYNLH